MNRKEAERLTRQQDTLTGLGFTRDEAEALRRISMTLRRWHELECGTDCGYVDRDEETKQTYFVIPATMRRPHDIRTRIPDRETGARKRLARILNARNERERPIQHTPETCPGRPCGDCCDHVERPYGTTLATYIQTDPRGAALYILRPGDVPKGERADSYYSRGVCVY